MEKKYMLRSEYDGCELSVMEMIPETGIRGVVQLVHGMCEHKERYQEFMTYLFNQGFACIIHDHRGHGESVDDPSDYGYMYGGGGEALVADVAQIQKNMKERFQDKFYVLLGHSMGSLAVRTFLKNYDDRVDMVILCGSPSKNRVLPMGKAIVSVQKHIHGDRYPGRLLEMLSFGPYALRFPEEKSRFSWVCSDPEVSGEYERSPKCGFTFTLDGYEALFDLMEETYSRKGWKCQHPDLPVLFVSGREDPCMGNVRMFKAALDHLRMAGYHNVRGKIYPGMRHEILNEPERAKVYHDIGAFIRKGSKISDAAYRQRGGKSEKICQ